MYILKLRDSFLILENGFQNEGQAINETNSMNWLPYSRLYCCLKESSSKLRGSFVSLVTRKNYSTYLIFLMPTDLAVQSLPIISAVKKYTGKSGTSIPVSSVKPPIRSMKPERRPRGPLSGKRDHEQCLDISQYQFLFKVAMI